MWQSADACGANTLFPLFVWGAWHGEKVIAAWGGALTGAASHFITPLPPALPPPPDLLVRPNPPSPQTRRALP